MTTTPIVLRPACIKTLSAVEAHPERSNQHEFNGVQQLKDIFGLGGFERPAIFTIRGTNTAENASVTWYDAREAHPTRSEHRLYFQTNRVMQAAQEGDNILIGFDRHGELNVILIPRNAEGYRANVSNWEAA